MLPFLSLHVKSPFENHERRPRVTYDLRDFQTESFLARYLIYLSFPFQLFVERSGWRQKRLLQIVSLQSRGLAKSCRLAANRLQDAARRIYL